MADFLRNPKDVFLETKKANLLIGGTYVPFRYNKIPRVYLERIELLKNIAMQENEIVIKTTSTNPFNVQNMIMVDHEKYTIKNIYTDDSVTENSMLGIKTPYNVKYLVLSRLGV